MLVEFPSSLLREQSVSIELVSRVVSAGVTGAGVQPLMATDGGGLWSLTLANISLRDKDHIRAWRAIAALCDGGLNPLVMPICDNRFAPYPLVNGRPVYSRAALPHSDGTFFSDGSGYVQDVIDAEAVGSAALRATTIRLRVNYGSALMGGEHFSIDHPTMRHRIYRIGAVSERDDGDFDVTIRPPLREALSGGEIAAFDQPKCIMQPVEQGGLRLDLHLRRTARPSIRLIEAFTSEMLA